MSFSGLSAHIFRLNNLPIPPRAFSSSSGGSRWFLRIPDPPEELQDYKLVISALIIYFSVCGVLIS